MKLPSTPITRLLRFAYSRVKNVHVHHTSHVSIFAFYFSFEFTVDHIPPSDEEESNSEDDGINDKVWLF